MIFDVAAVRPNQIANFTKKKNLAPEIMKNALLSELNSFKVKLTNINTTWWNIEARNDDSTLRNRTITELTSAVNDIRDRVDRFYSEHATYRTELTELKAVIESFRFSNTEINPKVGKSLDNVKFEVMAILDGFTSSVRLYDFPSDRDVKIDR
jgi:hypothetical protein